MKQILISHRGNIFGRNISRENTCSYIDEAIEQGFDVEIDIRIVDDKIYLGHDTPDTEIEFYFLLQRKRYLWCHAKNLEALIFLLQNNLHCFSHDTDDYILTSKGFIWAYPGQKINDKTICVMPERANYDEQSLLECKGICSDNIVAYL